MFPLIASTTPRRTFVRQSFRIFVDSRADFGNFGATGDASFCGSNALLVGLLVTGAAALFPVMLYSTLAPENSLTAYSVAAGRSALLLASIWWPVGFALAIGYFLFISRRYAGKVSVRRETQGFY